MKKGRHEGRKASKIREDYDYMDSIPFNGWIWEIVRRKKEYRDAFNRCEAERNHSLRNDIWENHRDVLVADVPLDSHEAPEVKHFLPIFTARVAIARPSIKYSEFKKGQRPEIAAGSPVVAKTMDQMQSLLRDMTPLIVDDVLNSLSRQGTHNNHTVDPRRMVLRTIEEVRNYMLWALSPAMPKDTIYVGVARRAKKTDVKEHLDGIINQYNKRRGRIRTDKWKYYLITYDLKAQGFTYDEIGDILQDVYGDVTERAKFYFDEDIERFYKEAVILIEKDGYKAYLL